MNTNSHCIPLQIMRKFVTNAKLNADGRCIETNPKKTNFKVLHTLYSAVNKENIDSSCFSFDCETTCSPCRKFVFNEETIQNLQKMFRYYCNLTGNLTVMSIGPVCKSNTDWQSMCF